MLHNYTRERGGEDISFESEVTLLRKYGHEVITYTKQPIPLHSSFGTKARAALNLVWNHTVYTELKRIIKKERPDSMHVQRVYPLLSPSVYYAAKHCKIPVVQALRSYWLICPSVTLYNKGKIDETSLGSWFPWKAILKRVRQNSFLKTLLFSCMLTVHKILGTWNKHVDCFIATSHFLKNKYVEAGFPAGKIKVKPNFVFVDVRIKKDLREYSLYVGRLSPEKGLHTLLTAWKQIKRNKLLIVGTGPLDAELRKRIQSEKIANISLVGEKSEKEVSLLLGKSKCIIVPSEWYEPFGRIIIEAYAAGVPVIATNHAGPKELVHENKTGLLFRSGDARDLQAKILSLLKSPSKVRKMGNAARKVFNKEYTAEKNYQYFLKIYTQVLKQHDKTN